MPCIILLIVSNDKIPVGIGDIVGCAPYRCVGEKFALEKYSLVTLFNLLATFSNHQQNQ